MSVSSKPIVRAGDRVRDQIDGRIRTVTGVDTGNGTVYMADGGVMGLDECQEVYLPGEPVPQFESGTTSAIADADRRWSNRVRRGDFDGPRSSRRVYHPQLEAMRQKGVG